MNFKIIPLTNDLINESFFETHSNLKDIEKWIEETKKLWTQQSKNPDYIRLVAVEGEKNVIWSICCLLEQKFIIGHVIWGHLEDVVTRKWYEWIWIWKALVNEVSKIAKSRWCKKIWLSCKTENIDFYKKCWYKIWSNKMIIDL